MWGLHSMSFGYSFAPALIGLSNTPAFSMGPAQRRMIDMILCCYIPIGPLAGHKLTTGEGSGHD